MKNVFYAVLMGFLLIGAPVSLLAQEDPDFTEVKIIGEDGESKTFPIRLEEAKRKFEDKINDAKEKRVAAACVAAQTKVASVIEKTQNFQTRHTEVHQKWLTKLTDLSARINLAGIDTTTLDGYVQELNALVSQNSSDLVSYVAGLEDVSSVDCEADATGFYSALQEARAARSLVIDDTKDVLTYIRENIKTELQNIKQQLKDAKQSSDAQEDNGGAQ